MNKSLKKIVDIVMSKNGLMVLIAIFFLLIMFLTLASGSGDNGVGSDDEKKLSNVLSKIDGVGKVEVMINYETKENAYGQNQSSKVTGVVIVAQGANNYNVKLNLIDAAKIATNVDAKYIEVYEMRK